MIKQYLNKAQEMLDLAKLVEAKCSVQFAFELGAAEDIESAKVGHELQEAIEKQMKLLEYERQQQIEMRIAAVKADVNISEQANEEEGKNIKLELEI